MNVVEEILKKYKTVESVEIKSNKILQDIKSLKRAKGRLKTQYKQLKKEFENVIILMFLTENILSKKDIDMPYYSISHLLERKIEKYGIRLSSNPLQNFLKYFRSKKIKLNYAVNKSVYSKISLLLKEKREIFKTINKIQIYRNQLQLSHCGQNIKKIVFSNINTRNSALGFIFQKPIDVNCFENGYKELRIHEETIKGMIIIKNFLYLTYQTERFYIREGVSYEKDIIMKLCKECFVQETAKELPVIKDHFLLVTREIKKISLELKKISAPLMVLEMVKND